jgi:hypothetical protein
MPTIKKPEINTDLTKAAKDIAAVAKDATYVVIGAGVLGFQQVQVHRQELQKRLSDPKAGIEDRVNSVRNDLSGGTKPRHERPAPAGRSCVPARRSPTALPVAPRGSDLGLSFPVRPAADEAGQSACSCQ